MIISEVRVGIVDGGMACGPVFGNVVGEAMVYDGDRVFFAGLVEVDGLMNWYESDESLYDMIIKDDYEDTDFIDWGCEYDEYLENPDEDPEKDALIRYLIYVVRTDWDTCREFISKTKGKEITEIEIPVYTDDAEYEEE